MRSIFRSATFLVGLALSVGAFLAFLVLGNILNPPPYQALVITRDVTPGTALAKDMVATSAQGLSSRVAAGYVLAGELNAYLGATIVEPLHAGDPLTKIRLVREGNPAAVRRAALGLDNPSLTLMLVPVDDTTAPDNIVYGDRVDLIYTVGREPTSSGETSLNPYARPGAVTGDETEEEEESVILPLAKLVFKDLKVARTHREKQPNPSYSGAEGESPYIEGTIDGLEVVVERQQEELLGWAIRHGTVHVALVSPNAPPDTSIATMGMTWEDLVEWFKMSRQGELATLSGQTAPPIPPAAGAAAAARATAQAQVMIGLGAPLTPAALVPPVGESGTPAPGAATPGAMPGMGATPPAGALGLPGAAATAAAAVGALAATVPAPTSQPPTSTPAVVIELTVTSPGDSMGASPSLLATGFSFLLCGGVLLAGLVFAWLALKNRNKGGAARL